MIEVVPSMVLIVKVTALGFLLWLETVVPLFLREPGQRVRHDLRNVAIGIINAVVLTAGFAGLAAAAVRWGADHPVGVLHWFSLPGWLSGLFGFLLFDFWMYVWHRANHGVSWLWRFHRVHHSDLAMDATTALRFHAGEMILSVLLRLAVIPLLGITLGQLLLYELILQPVILFHHSNVALPERWDRLLRLLVVSPNMHRVHHSDIPAETNSNYASIFSFWDRLGRTHRRREVATIQYGLKEFQEPRWQS
ncbi:MAG: sterol desaturase family protein, partial [Candidatus Omnitrophica bacterium]|nr:sterol desaturase family protein [Candidatus Omnitrophota bacterium]